LRGPALFFRPLSHGRYQKRLNSIGNPMSGRTFLAIAVAALLVAPAAAQSTGAGDYCYLVADNNGVRFDADVLTMVDKISGLETEVGLTGTLNIEAIAFHPFTPTIFAADGGLLGTIDVSTGNFSPVGWLGTAYGDSGPLSAGDVDGLTFDPSSGELFGSVRQTGTDFLVQIDPNNGRVVENGFGVGRDYVHVSFTGAEVHVDDIAVSPITGNLFAVVTDLDENSTLVTIDRISGNANSLAALSVLDLEGLSFDADGRLFASPGGDGPNLVEVNLATGQATPFAAVGVNSNRDYEAVTCMTYGAFNSTAAEAEELPLEISLLPAYPNPFNPTTTFSFALPAASGVNLSVFDMLGRQVETLADGFWQAGEHQVRFEAAELPSGLYFYRLSTATAVLTRTVTLLR
jgi:Secretion system C-terminal sorting domain